MKKLVSLMMVLCMLCGATAFAENQTITESDADPDTVSMELTLDLSGSYGYTVIIPSELSFGEAQPLEETDAETEDHVYYQAVATVSVTKAKIEADILAIYTESGEDGFVLMNDAGDTIGYRLEYDVVEGGAGQVEDNVMIMNRYETGDFQLTFTTDSAPEDGFPAGTFKETLSFRVALEGGGEETEGE